MHVGDTLWAYAHDAPRGAIGTAVGLAQRAKAAHVGVVVDEAQPALGAAAGEFSTPDVAVWVADGRALRRVEPAAIEIPAPPPPDELTALIVDAGLDLVADHHVWLGEWNGLELARVGVRDGDPAGHTSIDIGVGAYDQFASAALTADRNDAAALARVIELVRPHRVDGAEPHPMGRLVRSRWLRASACRAPGAVGADWLEPVPLPYPRPGMMESQPAAAFGKDGQGSVLVVFGVGPDLGIVEEIGALASVHRPSRAVLAMPGRDLHPRITDSLDALAVPTTTCAIEGDWSG